MSNVSSVEKEKCKTNVLACVVGWTKMVKEILLCTAGGHVDDFVFGCNGKEPEALKAMNEMKASFPWGEWRHDRFVQCGVECKHDPNKHELTPNQESFAMGMSEMELNAQRTKQLHDKFATEGRTHMRNDLGWCQ